MDKTLIHHSRVKSAVSSRWKPSKTTKDANINRKISASVLWDIQRILVINYFEKGRTINSKYIVFMVRLKEEIAKKKPQKKKKNVSFTKTMHHVKSQSQHKFRIFYAPTLSPRSEPQWLLAICRPQKNTPGKENWLQWRSYIGNLVVFYSQRQIVLQKGHRIVKEALESVYQFWKRLFW